MSKERANLKELSVNLGNKEKNDCMNETINERMNERRNEEPKE
jgi:hypothetical protein